MKLFPPTGQISTYAEACQVAKDYDSKLSAYDFKQDQWVLVLHEEGSQFLFRYAFVRQWKDWWMVFTEHHLFHVYHKTDLSFIGQFTKSENVPPVIIDGSKDRCRACKKEFPVEELHYEPYQYDGPIVQLCDVCREEAVKLLYDDDGIEPDIG